MKLRLTRRLMLLGLLLATAAAAQQPAGRFNRFWRNAFETKKSYPTLRVLQAQERHAFLGVMQGLSLSGGSLAGSMFAATLQGPIQDNYLDLIQTLGVVRLVPDAPFDLDLVAVGGAVAVNFQFSGTPRALYVFTLFHFDHPHAAPRRVASVANSSAASSGFFQLVDDQSPESGTTFYSVTATRIRGWDPATALSKAEVKQLTPWWTYPISGESDNYVTWWSDQRFGYMSDYSEPVVYNAEPAPPTGGIDAIAIEPRGQTVYISRPGEGQITSRAVGSAVAGAEWPFVDTWFPPPGQKGLAVGSGGELYADNGASDAAYGGRIFRFDPDGTRTFTGSINYFSQFLMYAKPVEAGPMVMTPEGQLLAADFIEREWKQVPVQAAYDPYRRIGRRFVRFDDHDLGQALDVEIGQYRTVYMLDREALTGFFLDVPVPMGRIPLPRQE